MTTSSTPRSLAVVDLGAIEDNYRQLRKFSTVPVICVVKADAYGHGAVEVARLLSAAGAEMLAVACVEEAAEIRDAGVETPILLLAETDPKEIPDALALDLHFSVYTPDYLEELARGARSSKSSVRIHIKVDTGMHRLGANPESALELLKRALDLDSLEVAGLWTHMAVADDPPDDFTNLQIERFRRFLEQASTVLEKRPGIAGPLVHAANSAAALAFPAARFDAVRSGICLYGVKPALEFPMPQNVHLSPALTWKSKVSLVRSVEPGARPSYGRTRSVRGSQLAVVPVGYADGYLRSLSNEADVLIRGRRHRIAGNVTMDHIIVECSPAHSSDEEVRPGDEVVLIGSQGSEEITAEELATRAGTIAYEVLTRIGRRVKRVYVRQGY